jgi:hypothetical protein
MLRLIRPAVVRLDARLQGPKLGVQALLDLVSETAVATAR